MLSVVRMSECLMSFCCTVIEVPTASSHERYVCLKLCVPSPPIPAAVVASCKALQYPVYEEGNRPSFTGEGKSQSSASPNSVLCFQDDRTESSSGSRFLVLREPSVFT